MPKFISRIISGIVTYYELFKKVRDYNKKPGMKFLFETITLSGPDHFFYRVYSSGKNEYFAEWIDHEGGFYFSWDIEWKADDPARQYEAEQIGEVIEKRALPLLLP